MASSDRDFAEDTALDADYAALGILRDIVLHAGELPARSHLLGGCVPPDLSPAGRRAGWLGPGRAGSGAHRSRVSVLSGSRPRTTGSSSTVWEQLSRAGAKRPQNEIADYPITRMLCKESSPAARLAAWAQDGLSEDLGARFHESRAALETAGAGRTASAWFLASMCCAFSRVGFPVLGPAEFDLAHYLNLYLDRCPDPPADLTRIIERIIADAANCRR